MNRFTVTCSLCTRPGHVAADCPGRCQYCKEPTHLDKDCWSTRAIPRERELLEIALGIARRHHDRAPIFGDGAYCSP